MRVKPNGYFYFLLFFMFLAFFSGEARAGIFLFGILFSRVLWDFGKWFIRTRRHL